VYVSAIIAAGGRGARFGGDTPKQLLTLGGLPILQRTIDVFVDSPSVNEIVVALPRELAESPPAYLQSVTKTTRLVTGGERRRDSVARRQDPPGHGSQSTDAITQSACRAIVETVQQKTARPFRGARSLCCPIGRA